MLTKPQLGDPKWVLSNESVSGFRLLHTFSGCKLKLLERLPCLILLRAALLVADPALHRVAQEEELIQQVFALQLLKRTMRVL